MNTLNIIIFVVFLILGYILLTYRKNKKNVKYDERQAAIRNHGYKYAFITIAISDFVLLLLIDYLNVKMTPIFLLLAPLLIGCMAFTGYTIFKGAYIAMNEKNLLLSTIAFIVLGLLELVEGILGLFENAAKWDNNVLMLLFGLFLFLVGVNYAYQLYSNKVKK